MVIFIFIVFYEGWLHHLASHSLSVLSIIINESLLFVLQIKQMALTFLE